MRHFKSSKRVESTLQLNKKYKILTCSKCYNEIKVDSEALSVICYMCVNKLVSIESKEKIKSSFPPGWKILPIYVHNDGTVYHRGIEQPDLKGTLEPTNVEKIINNIKKSKKLNKKNKEKYEDIKQQELIEEHKLRLKEKKKNKELKNKILEQI